MPTCIDCGRPSTGLRCQKDHGAYLLRQTLRETAESDRAILNLRDVDNLAYGRIATRYAVSRTRARMKVIEARRREQLRQDMGELLWQEADAFFARVEP